MKWWFEFSSHSVSGAHSNNAVCKNNVMMMLTGTLLCQNMQVMVGSLLVQVFMWIINNTRCIFPGADSCSVLLLAQSLYVSFLTKPQGSQSLTFLSSSYIKGAQWNFIDFGARFSTSTLRFMDMISLQTQRQASLSRLTSSTFLATGRLCQSSMGWLLLRKLFSKARVLKLGSQSSQILYIWKKFDLSYQWHQTDSIGYGNHFLIILHNWGDPHDTLHLNIYLAVLFQSIILLQSRMVTETVVIE